MIVVNLLFGMLAMFHLAYLGVMFDQVRKQKLYLMLSDLLALFYLLMQKASDIPDDKICQVFDLK